MSKQLTTYTEGASDVGRQRQNNQDNLLIDDPFQLYAVADGIGGSAGGEIASAHVLEVVRESLQDSFEHINDNTPQNIVKALKNAVQDAADSLHILASQDERHKDMGTTLTLLLLRGKRAFMAHIGDSRLYMQRDDKLYQLSTDHTLAEELVQRGTWTRDDIRPKSPANNILTRAFGRRTRPRPDLRVIAVRPGDTLLLCSDGLTAYLDNQELCSLLYNRETPGLARTLINMANERGGRDNITALLVRISPPNLRAPAPLSQPTTTRTTRLLSSVAC